ncbi:MAG: hypothetical protein IPK26_06100 [Planctomycetes bacterium]|nr:hypothetical protein [Planctomycetota bacterium]
MQKPARLTFVGAILAILAAIFYPQLMAEGGAATAANPATTPPPAEPAPRAATSHPIGFTSKRSWQEHFDKHGAEFGNIDADEYLARAKALRDAPLSRDVLESKRQDGVITRFHRKTGGFVAFHADLTIRTFFRPDDGEAYFKRQLDRP